MLEGRAAVPRRVDRGRRADPAFAAAHAAVARSGGRDVDRRAHSDWRWCPAGARSSRGASDAKRHRDAGARRFARSVPGTSTAAECTARVPHWGAN